MDVRAMRRPACRCFSPDRLRGMGSRHMKSEAVSIPVMASQRAACVLAFATSALFICPALAVPGEAATCRYTRPGPSLQRI